MTTSGLALLSGVRVVDFTQALSGPYCTMMLADLGADVIKVESPQRGDDARHWGPPFLGQDAAYFLAVNRNKRSVALDLKSPTGLEAAAALVATADVMVENWRPGTAARLGLGLDAMRSANPALVYCSISGYGQDGDPRSGYDQIVQGTSGVMHLTGPIGSPTKWGVPVADIAAGMFASTAIVAALLERTRTGQGRGIDVSMQDSMIAMLSHQGSRFLNTGRVPPSDYNSHTTIAPYGLFRSADGFVNVCVGNDSQYQRMCTALDRSDLAEDPRYQTNSQRLAAKPELLAELEPLFASLPSDHIIDALEAAGVPVGPVLDIGQVLDSDRTAQREMVVSFQRADSGTVRTTNTPWKIDGQAPQATRPAPTLGQHNEEILSALPAGKAGKLT